jgi:hypothetical protein
LDLAEPNIFPGYITVQDGLVERITALNGNVVHLFEKSWVANQRKNEIILILVPMGFPHADDLVRVERGKNGGNRRLRSWF